MCSVENEKGKFLVLYIVHTKPSHLDRRQLIRSSWGQVKDSKGFNSRVIFVMGKEERVKQRKSMRNPKLALLPPKKYVVSKCFYATSPDIFRPLIVVRSWQQAISFEMLCILKM